MKKIITCVVSLLVLFTVLVGILAYRNEWFSSHKEYDENNIGECYFQETKEEHIATSDSCMYADNEILVVAKENVKKSQIEKLAKKYDADIVGWIEQTGDYQWKMNSIYSIDELESIVSKLESENIIDSASINYISETSESELPVNYGKEWSGETWDENDHAGSNWGLEAIHALSAWEVLEKHKEKVNPIKLGLIDNGFDTNHEDLKGSFAEVFYNTSPNDHGTHVAGIMSANSDNNEGICGVYPYGKGNLYGVSFEGVTGYSENNISCMLEKCAFSELILRNVKVINCSYGRNSDCLKVELYNDKNVKAQIEKEADILTNFFYRLIKLKYDFVIIKAAGNLSNFYYTKLKVDNNDDLAHDDDGKVIYDENGDVFAIQYINEEINGEIYQGWYSLTKVEGYNKYPKICDLEDENIKHANYIESKYGSSISAIGYDETDKIASEVKDRIIVVGSIGIETNYKDDSGYHISNFSNLGNRVDVFAPGENIFSTVINGYDKKDGTSMAAPHVAGIAAMVWAANNNLTGAEVKEIICSTANHLINQVDAKSAVEKALGIEKEKTTAPQNGGILCWVVNKDNEDEKIEGASVTATNIDTGETESTKTDSNGHFELFLTEGNYTLTVAAKEYDDYTYNGTIEVKNNSVNYLDDWIKMTKSKKEYTESDLKEKVIAESGGNIGSWIYEDFDGDGTKEAFAIIDNGIKNEFNGTPTIEAIYFIDSDANIRKIKSEFDLPWYSDDKYIEYESKGFFSVDVTASGSSWITYLFGVKDGNAYELNISGDLQGFYNKNGMCYTTTGDFSQGYHTYPEVELIYNSSTQQFSKGDRITSEEKEETSDWASAYIEVLSNLRYSTGRFTTAYIDEDDIPELIVSYGNAHVAGCEVYTYYDGKAIKLKSDSTNDEFGSSGEILYSPGENLFVSRYYGMGSNIDGLYRIKNGVAQLECTLNHNDYFNTVRVIEFKIDGTDVSENEYWDKYNSYEIDSMSSLNYDDMVEANSTNISNYFN